MKTLIILIILFGFNLAMGSLTCYEERDTQAPHSSCSMNKEGTGTEQWVSWLITTVTFARSRKKRSLILRQRQELRKTTEKQNQIEAPKRSLQDIEVYNDYHSEKSKLKT